MQEPKEKQEPIDIQYELAKKKILDKIVNKSVLCSKSTVNFTTRTLEALMSMDKKKLIELSENGLPDDLPEMRSLIWKINFEYLPLDPQKWGAVLVSKRASYKNYRNFVFEKLEKELKLLENYDNLSAVDKKIWIKLHIKWF